VWKCAGGWVGYFSYDTVRYTEKKKLPFSAAPDDDRRLPDIHLGLYNDVLVFDHVSKVLLLYIPLPSCPSFCFCVFSSTLEETSNLLLTYISRVCIYC